MSLNKRSRSNSLNLEIELGNLISRLEEENSEYYNFEKILEDFKESVKKHSEGMMNRCVECNCDIGRTNPRQLCGKTYCINS
jgi:hypothetical protein